jgi:hypothetical protein
MMVVMKTTSLTLHSYPDATRFVGLAAAEVLLPAQVILRLDGDQRGVRLHAHGGNLWVTQSGDAQDHLVCPGKPFTVDRAGGVLVQALPKAWLRIQPAETGRPNNRPGLITRIKTLVKNPLETTKAA